MKSVSTGIATLLVVSLFACNSPEKPEQKEQAAVPQVNTADLVAKEVAEHRDVIHRLPSELTQHIRSNDLNTARRSTETMYRTLTTLETNKSLASQVCFGGSEWACKNFQSVMAADIKTLYKGFVVSNSLSTGDVFKLAAKIGTFTDLDGRFQSIAH